MMTERKIHKRKLSIKKKLCASYDHIWQTIKSVPIAFARVCVRVCTQMPKSSHEDTFQAMHASNAKMWRVSHSVIYWCVRFIKWIFFVCIALRDTSFYYKIMVHFHSRLFDFSTLCFARCIAECLSQLGRSATLLWTFMCCWVKLLWFFVLFYCYNKKFDLLMIK